MSNVTIPSAPEDKKKILNALQEFSNSMTRIEAERDLLKQILIGLQEDFDLPKKYMRKVANVYHKQNLNEFKLENEEVEDLYESIVNVQATS